MKVRFAPTGKTVLIRPIAEKQQVTAGGIIIPDSAQQEPPLIGEIVRVSDYAHSVGGYREGQKILYRRFRGHDVKIDGETYKVIEDIEENIFGIFEDNE